MSKKESLTITPVDERGNPHYIIKGSTVSIKDALLAGGAIWQGRELTWRINGAEIPKSIEEAIGETYGMYGLPKHPAATREYPPPGSFKKPMADRGALARAMVEDTESDLPDVVYNISEINYGFGEHIIKRGTKGKVLRKAQDGRAEILFEGWDKFVMCDWDELTTDTPAKSIQTYPGGHCNDCKEYTHEILVVREGVARCPSCDAKFIDGDLFRQPVVIPAAAGDEVLQEQQQLKVGQFVKHKIVTHIQGVIASISGGIAMVNVANLNSADAGFTATQYRLIDLEPRDYDLPIRQVEMLQAIRDKQPFQHNAATRAALRRYGMITQAAKWEDIALMPAGSGWLENFGPSSVSEPTSGSLGSANVIPNKLTAINDSLTVLEDFTTDTIESRYGVEQGDDWMKWSTCYNCGAYIADPVGHVWGLGDICDTCDDARQIAPIAQQDKPQKASKTKQATPEPETPKNASKNVFSHPGRVTPLRKQYLDIKAQYPAAILFFRLGDYYETFDNDAETAARECDLVLTGRAVSKSERVPMAGVPHHALDQYVNMLTSKGYTVAVAEQIGEPSGVGVVERKVVRVEKPTSDVRAAKEPPAPNALAWEKRTIKILVQNENKDGVKVGKPFEKKVDADVYGQLAVTPVWNGQWVSDRWMISHVKSGRKISTSLSFYKASLHQLVEQLSSLDFDDFWETKQQGLNREDFVAEVDRIREAFVKEHEEAESSPIGEPVDDEKVADVLGELVAVL